MELKDIMNRLHQGVGEALLKKLEDHLAGKKEINNADLKTVLQFLKDNHIDTVPTGAKVTLLDDYVTKLNKVAPEAYPDADDPLFKEA